MKLTYLKFAFGYHRISAHILVHYLWTFPNKILWFISSYKYKNNYFELKGLGIPIVKLRYRIKISIRLWKFVLPSACNINIFKNRLLLKDTKLEKYHQIPFVSRVACLSKITFKYKIWNNVNGIIDGNVCSDN